MADTTNYSFSRAVDLNAGVGSGGSSGQGTTRYTILSRREDQTGNNSIGRKNNNNLKGAAPAG